VRGAATDGIGTAAQVVPIRDDEPPVAWFRTDPMSHDLARPAAADPTRRAVSRLRSRLAALRGEAGAVLLSSLVKFVVVVAIIGVVGYDGFSIAHTQVSVRDDAQQAAQVAHDALRNRSTPQEAYAAALAYAKAHGSTIATNGFQVGADNSVTVTLTATAKTFVAGRIPALHDYVSPSATASAANSIY
jgi:Tfp pilus assembly protein PilV